MSVISPDKVRLSPPPEKRSTPLMGQTSAAVPQLNFQRGADGAGVSSGVLLDGCSNQTNAI